VSSNNLLTWIDFRNLFYMFSKWKKKTCN